MMKEGEARIKCEEPKNVAPTRSFQESGAALNDR